MPIRISAVICTHNRVDYLRKAISSLAIQTLPRDDYEVLVVDNGSTDSTRKVVCREFAEMQNLKYLYEPVLGLSQARNTGWRHACGEFVAYLDDDAIASDNWLKTILDVFEITQMQLGCLGGKVEPIWEAPRPRWLSDFGARYLTIVDWSETPIVPKARQWLAGANIVFPRHLLERAEGFPLYLGRTGRRLLSGEEILLQQRLEKDGYSCLYHPEIVVQHHVPVSRLNQRWLLRRAYWGGVSDAILGTPVGSYSTPGGMRTEFAIILNVLLLPFLLINLVLPTNDPKRFTLKCSTVAQIGYVLGLLGIAK